MQERFKIVPNFPGENRTLDIKCEKKLGGHEIFFRNFGGHEIYLQNVGGPRKCFRKFWGAMKFFFQTSENPLALPVP